MPHSHALPELGKVRRVPADEVALRNMEELLRLRPEEVHAATLHAIGSSTLYRINEPRATADVIRDSIQIARSLRVPEWIRDGKDTVERHQLALVAAEQEAQGPSRMTLYQLLFAANKQAETALTTVTRRDAEVKAALAVVALRDTAVEVARAALLRAEQEQHEARQAAVCLQALHVQEKAQSDALISAFHAKIAPHQDVETGLQALPVPGSPEMRVALRTLAAAPHPAVLRCKDELNVAKRHLTDLLDQERLFTILDKLDTSADQQAVQQGLQDLETQGLIVLKKRGWSLTKDGVPEAVQVRPQFTPENVTSAILSGILTAEMIKGAEKYLAAKCRRSETFGEIRDLLHIFVEKLVGRDGLHHRLMKEKIVPRGSQLRLWIYRSALSQFRNEGRDALTRTFKGAKTERDLRGDESVTRDTANATGNRVVYLAEDSGNGRPGAMLGTDADGPLIDAVGGDDQEMLAQLAYQSGMARLSDIISHNTSRPGVADRLVRVLALVAEGFTTSEIAAQEGVPKNRVSALVTDARETIRRGVLTFIYEEPCSTVDEVQDEFGPVSKVIPGVVLEMIQNGQLSWQGKKGCLRITDAGKSAARIHEARS